MTLAHPKKIVAGMAIALVGFVCSALLSTLVKDSHFWARVMLAAAFLAVAIPVCEWGAVLGYRIQADDGRICIGHALRCAVMTAIASGVALFMSALVLSVALPLLK